MDQPSDYVSPKAALAAPRRLEAVLNNATVAIFFMDDRQQCVYMNRAAEELTGFTLGEVVALDKPLHDIIHHTHPDGRPFPLCECEIDRAFPEHNKVQGEIQDDSANTIGTIVEVIDITPQMRATERRNMLVNELDHRVKNTLATVQAFAWQSFKHLDPKALEQFAGRLGVLAKAHNILTRTSWYAAPLDQIVTETLKPFGLDRFEFNGPTCEVHPKAAVSIAMVLHELATNAVKYGSLSVPSGTVTLHWACTDLPDHTKLDMNWEERGGPPVAQPSERGFGSRLIERQLALEFGGKAEIKFQEKGVLCQMHLQLPRNSEPVDLQSSSRSAA